MVEENETKPTTVNYSSNSQKAKKAESSDAVAVKEIRQITQGGVVTKQSLGSKFRETFAGDDAQSVGQYLLFDVVVPATKNLISDMVSQGIERLLFGTSRPSGSSSIVGGGRTRYRSAYRGEPERERSREITYRDRATHNFGDIRLDSRGEAEEVLDQLSDLISEYGVATIADLYASVGITAEFTDTKYGWKNISTSSPRRVGGGGYVLDLPRPVALD